METAREGSQDDSLGRSSGGRDAEGFDRPFGLRGDCLYPETMSDRNARTVYSTGSGSICPKCGWPARDCKCSSQFARSEPLPARIVAKLRIEKTGRSGKTVTVVYDLPRNPQFLKDLASELKRACGAGGAVVDNTVELQGDLRDRIRTALQKKGWTVKG